MASGGETTKNTKRKPTKKRNVSGKKSVSPGGSDVDETILDYEIVFDKKSERSFLWN